MREAARGGARTVIIAVVGSLAALVVLLAALYAWLSAVPTPTVNYLTKLNEPARALPEADRGWPLYVRAWVQLVNGPLEVETLQPAEWLTQEGVDATTPSPFPAEVIEPWLEEHTEALALLREAAAKPAFGIVLAYGEPEGYEAVQRAKSAAYSPPTAYEESANRSLIGVLLPALSDFRRSSRWLRADARVALRRGDADRAVADFEAMVGLAAHAGERAFLIGQLVASAVYGLSVQEIGRALTLHGGLFEESHLARLDAALARFDPVGSFGLAIEGETVWIDDSLQRAYSDGGKGRLLPRGGAWLEWIGGGFNGGSDVLETGADTETALDVHPISGVKHIPEAVFGETGAQSREIVARLNAAVAGYSALPPFAWSASPAYRESRAIIQQIDSGRVSTLVEVFVPAIGPAAKSVARNAHHSAWLRAVIAAYRHRVATGAFPARWADISPELLPGAPRDAFRDTELGYRLAVHTTNRVSKQPEDFSGPGAIAGPVPLVWSVGADLVDDAGRAAEAAELADVWGEAFKSLAATAADAPGAPSAAAMSSLAEEMRGDMVVFPVSTVP